MLIILEVDTTNLFIIGNGFDLAHSMETKYSHFRQFLIDNYLDGKYEAYSYCDVPQTTLMPDGDEVYNEADVVKSILKILDNAEGTDWNEIETTLGDLPYDSFLDEYGFSDPNDDNYTRDIYFRNQDLSQGLCGALCQIGKYFHEWVKSIKVSKKQENKFRKIIDPQNDLFINFNYTNTLQALYNVQKVCHIHGTSRDKIYFGHGETECPREDYEIKWFGAESSLERLYFDLKKDTSEAYRNHEDFFNELQTIANNSSLNIYSYGFSFSKVDRYYLTKICEIINTEDICFYMNNYDDDKKRNEFANVLQECGFKGRVDEFYK